MRMQSLIHEIARTTMQSVMKELADIERGADVDATDSQDDTPLALALRIDPSDGEGAAKLLRSRAAKSLYGGRAAKNTSNQEFVVQIFQKCVFMCDLKSGTAKRR